MKKMIASISSIEQEVRELYEASLGESTEEQKKYLETIKSLYSKYPIDIVADQYAHLLFDYSFRLEDTSKQREIIDRMETLFSKHRIENIAVCIARSKYNLSLYENLNVADLKKYANEIEQLYQEFPTDTLAEPLAKIWSNIFLSHAHDKVKYGRKVLDLCQHIHDPNANTAFSRVLFSDKIKIENREELIQTFFNEEQDIDSIWTYINSPFYPSYNKYLKNFKLNESYPVENLGKRINQYLKKLKKEKNYIELKISFLAILYCTLNIKKLLACPKIDHPIGHYTKMRNIKFLLSNDKKASDNGNSGKMRMNNAYYMNDPLEGKTLLNFLSVSENINIKEDFGDKIYLACFTTAIDELPMWSMYGDDGQGCCLILNDKYFDYTNEDISDSLVLHFGAEDNNYYLYRVCYLSNNSNDFDVDIDILNNDENKSELQNQVKDCLNVLRIWVEKCLSIPYKKTEWVSEILSFILSQIKYLFKDKSYAHEKELRLIKYSENPKLDDSFEIIPQLYLELEKPLEYDELILGPKVTNINKIIPYIMYTGKVKTTKTSDIKYR